MKGIDVSEWQTNINFTPNSGVEFVYIKATEGLHTIDKRAVAHMIACQKANIPYGFYHFMHTETENPALQANFFKYVLNSVLTGATLFPVIDIESNPTHLTPMEIETQLHSFINTFSEAGIMIYSSPGFLNVNLPPTHSFGQYPLWVAEYTNAPQPKIPVGWKDYAVWQYTDKLNIPDNQFDFDGDVCPDETLITN